MARIIESENGGRRIIKMSVDDILSVVRDYQNIVPRFSSAEDTRNYLSDTVFYLPEDIQNIQKSSEVDKSARAFFASS